MIWAVLLLLLSLLVGLIVWRHSEPPPSRPLDPEQALKATLELHRIRRNLDARDLKHARHREEARVKREISKALNADTP